MLLLKQLGYDVAFAYSGELAVVEAIRFEPDSVLLDIALPEMDGYEVARRLRAFPRLAEVRLIALSGYGQEADRRRSMESGFDAHLLKPVELHELLKALDPEENGSPERNAG